MQNFPIPEVSESQVGRSLDSIAGEEQADHLHLQPEVCRVYLYKKLL